MTWDSVVAGLNRPLWLSRPSADISPALVRTLRLSLDSIRILGDESRLHVRLDIPLAVIAAIYLFAFVPIIPHAADNPQLLACCINDEPMLTMALDGMLAAPYGDPYTYLLWAINGKPIPAYWDGFNYAGSGWYYGGLYPGLAFLVYSPLRALGIAPFPMAPIILRTLSLLGGLLALMVTYNFGRYHAGRIAATVAALIVVTDTYFSHYSSIVHPDTLQFALGMLALAVAARHLRQGDVASLAALGLVCGLLQGTKMGGPWLVPIAGVALAIPLWRQRSHQRLPALFRTIAGRGTILVVFAGAAYLLSTPYLVLGRDFLIQSRSLLANVWSGHLTTITYVTWLSDLWSHFGPVLLIAAATGAALVLLQAAFGNVRWPMLLALVLGLSQLAWYSINGKLWVELGYMLCLFAVIGLFAGDLVQQACRALARVRYGGQVLAAGLATLTLAALVCGEWWGTAALALHYRLIESNTVIEIGRWAEAGHIPRDARILWDDLSYFDPAKFRSARMLGGLMTYNDLYTRQPDYIVISSSIYEARHYAELIRTQHYTMQNEGANSMRLYQDLLGSAGTTPVPGIAYVRSFSADNDRRVDCDSRSGTIPYVPWFGQDGPAKAAESVVTVLGAMPGTGWLGQRVATQVSLLNVAGRQIDALRGRVCVSTGPTLRLYHINTPGSVNGFSMPFASSVRQGVRALAAFDGSLSTSWAPEQAETRGSFLGFDFGAETNKQVRQVQVDWGSASLAAHKIEIQHADFGGEWKSAGIFDVALEGNDVAVSSKHELAGSHGAHRLWRVVFRDVPAEHSIRVREVRFLQGAP